jgi:hypothetical protein
MHKNCRLLSVVHCSGKRLYGASAAARLKVCACYFVPRLSLNRGRKTENEDHPRTLSVPSAKSWARPPQNVPSVSTPSMPSRPPSRRDPSTWTTPNEVPRKKWAFPVALGSQDPGYRQDGSSSHPVKKQTSSSSAGQARALARDRWPPPHMARPSNTSKSLPRPPLDSRHQDERMRPSPERRMDLSLNTTPPAISQTSTNDASQQSRPRPDYSSFHVFRDHDDPQRAPRRKRDAPERNTYLAHNRRNSVSNKSLNKKSVKPKFKQIVRRKDAFIPTTLTVAMLARLLKVKLGIVYSPFVLCDCTIISFSSSTK